MMQNVEERKWDRRPVWLKAKKYKKEEQKGNSLAVSLFFSHWGEK